MTSEVVLHSGATPEDIFFGQTPHVTDWDAVYANASELRVDKLLDEAHTLEPLQETDVRDNQMWVIQQKIRIALRLAAKKPILSDVTCATCGAHQKDPVLYNCLWCEEWDRQGGRYGGRGNCAFIKPVYDAKSRSWGLLYYLHSHSRDSTYMFWLALGFRSAREIDLAMYPLALYQNWLVRKYNSLYQEWNIEERFFQVSEMLKDNDVPYSPEAFSQQVRERIRADMAREHNILDYYIDDAGREYDRAQRSDEDE